jgi:uncharacterized protein YnzC (UPF0291/DUF896 family)
MDDLIKRINELTALAKERELSQSETIERQKLREEYLEIFRSNFKEQLKAVKIVDENGSDVTPDKLKKIKDQ